MSHVPLPTHQAVPVSPLAWGEHRNAPATPPVPLDQKKSQTQPAEQVNSFTGGFQGESLVLNQ